MDKVKKQEFLARVKRNLTITWDEEDTNNSLIDYIDSSYTYLNGLAGCKLSFEASSQEAELLCERVRYSYNNALDDFEENFSKQLSAFILNSALQTSIQQEGEVDGQD